MLSGCTLLHPGIKTVPIDMPGGQRKCGGKVSCPRTQHKLPDQGSNPDRSEVQRTNHEATAPLTWYKCDLKLFYLRLSKRTHRSLRPQETTATGNQFLSHLLWRQTTKKIFDNDRETLLQNKKSETIPKTNSYQWTTDLEWWKPSMKPVNGKNNTTQEKVIASSITHKTKNNSNNHNYCA